MRSDPAGRWTGLDYSALLSRVVEGIVAELDVELDFIELDRIKEILDRLASFKIGSSDQNVQGNITIQFFKNHFLILY